MSQTNTHILFLMIGLLIFIPSQASSLRIVAQQSAVEADNITLKHDKKKNTATVITTGCTNCPLTLDATYGAEYFYKNKQVDEKKARSLSGQPGTVIYNAEKAMVISIRW